MINVENNRFPHSAELFKFCKEVLVSKKNSHSKVTDQDVGALLGFDPADCTHWKYGRKNIRSIQNMNQLASALELDLRSLIDLSLGKNALFDALLEYRGSGDFLCEAKEREILHSHANSLIQLSGIQSPPILTPEFSQIFSDIEMKGKEDQDEYVASSFEDGKYLITWKKQERIGTAMRFLMTKQLAETLLKKEPLVGHAHLSASRHEVLANLFALFLLIPSHLLQIACRQCDPACDLVEQLMGRFWLSRTLINIRLKDFLKYRN
jgi:hypothetical protein